MSKELTDLLELSTRGTLFPPTSRYHGIETATLERQGRTIVYLRRRVVPPPERFGLLQEHVVTEGERPDTLAGRYLADAEQSWRLCDANAVMHPAELTERVGRVLRITLPEGIPGDAGG
jgi:hypothetical protein